MVKRPILGAVLVTLCTVATLTSGLENIFKNPSFENGLSGWYIENRNCLPTNETAHTGSYSLHCKSTANQSGFVAQWNYLFPGLKYRISGYFKIKSIGPGGYVSLLAEHGIYGIWSYPKCPVNTTPPCVDEWVYFSEVTTMYLSPDNVTYIMEVVSKGDTEFWVDDIAFEMVTTDKLLRAAEVRSWRQEVFESKVEVLADLLITGTCFEKGDYLNLTLDVIDQSTQEVVRTITDYKIELRTENFLAIFILDPKGLKEGFYTMRVTMKNSLFGTTEVVETNMHKLGKKREYKRYIDNYNRVIDNGKPFFPLGLYTYTIFNNNTEIDTITDSPFNLVLVPTTETKHIDHIYNRSNGKIRSIVSLNCVTTISSNRTKMDQAIECAEKRSKMWSKSDGFFGYYLFDEPPLGAIPSMREVTLKLREIDYDHFIYPVINKRLNLHLYKEGFDVVGNDVYPVQHYDDLRAVAIVARQGRDRVMNSRAMWNVPQIFDWTVYNHTDEKPPTEKQLRHMTYQFIVGGGMGIIYYHYSEMQVMSWKNPVDKEWAKVKKVAKELQDKYVPIIMSGLDINPGLKLPVVEDYMCYARFFRYNGHDYVLAVNGWDNRVITCKFWVTNSTKTITKIEGESKIKRDGNKVTFDMPAMDIVWLKMSDSEFEDRHTEPSGEETHPSSFAFNFVPSVFFIVFVWFFMKF